MKKIELVKELLAFTDNLNEEIDVRILVRDKAGNIISTRRAPISSIGNFIHGNVINIEQATIKDDLQETCDDLINKAIEVLDPEMSRISIIELRESLIRAKVKI
jgi:hypothetical protein